MRDVVSTDHEEFEALGFEDGSGRGVLEFRDDKLRHIILQRALIHPDPACPILECGGFNSTGNQ